jgi:hypothetical protein
MSILDSLKVLDRPISELAKLPQQTIMQLAQNKQIPMGFVAPILSEKAEQAKTGAELAAVMQSQELPPSSILERVIAQNAAAESSNMAMPQQFAAAPQEMPAMEQDAGIASLPVSESMMPDEFAGGGIVAFAGPQGSLVQDPNRMAGEDVEPTKPLSAFEQDLLARQALYDRFLGRDQATEDLIKYTQEADKRAAADRDRIFYNRILKAGLNVLGGTSADPFENIGKGTAPEVEGYMSDIDKQRAAEMANRKALAEQQSKRRTEKASILKEALDNQAKLEAAMITSGKGTDMSRFVDNFVAAARAKGDKTDEAILKQIGSERYLALFGAAQLRGGAAAQQADIAGAKLEQTERQKAVEAVDKALAPGGNRNQQKEYNRIDREDRLANEKSGAQPGDPNYSNKAEEYRQRLIEERLRTTTPKPTAPKPAAAKPAAAKPTAAPSGLPAGATYMGTSGGKPVYKLPNGKMVIQE